MSPLKRKATSPPQPSPPTAVPSLKQRTRECSICIEAKSARRFPLDLCPTHSSSVCKACLVAYITETLSTHGEWKAITCLECSREISEREIVGVVQGEDMKSLHALSTRQSLLSSPHFHPCIDLNCPWGGLQSHPRNGHVVCVACKAEYCAIHDVSWHAGITCSQYDREKRGAGVGPPTRKGAAGRGGGVGPPTLKGDRASDEAKAKRKAKKCPTPGCHYYVVKSGGCDGIFCTGCGKSWFWGSVKFDGEKTEWERNEEARIAEAERRIEEAERVKVEEEGEDGDYEGRKGGRGRAVTGMQAMVVPLQNIVGGLVRSGSTAASEALGSRRGKGDMGHTRFSASRRRRT